MRSPVPPELTSLPEAKSTGEERANALVLRLHQLNPNPPDKLSDSGLPIRITFGELWAMCGGSLNGGVPVLPASTTITIRAYRDDKALTRAKLNRNKYPNTIFINTAHVRDPGLIVRLRTGYLAAAQGVVQRREKLGGLAYAFEIYKSLDGFPGARTTYLQTFEEEILHLVSGANDISKVTALMRLRKERRIKMSVRKLLQGTTKEGFEDRARPAAEKPVARFKRRTRYLGDDWELIARIGKLCRAAGHVPQNKEEVDAFVTKTVPLLLGGRHDLVKNDTSLWEVSRLGPGQDYFRPLAEVNALLLMLYPSGVSEEFRQSLLPYYFGMVGLLHGDGQAMAKMGYKGIDRPVTSKHTKKIMRHRAVYVPDV